MNTNPYESVDKLFSSYVVTCMKGKTRFYLTPELTATDILSRAKVYRWPDEARDEAHSQRQQPAWKGFLWIAETYAFEAAR